MKEPKLKDLKLDRAGTERFRSALKRPGKRVKITINIDGDSLSTLRLLAEERGAPYQRLLNQILREGLSKKSSTEERVSKLEREIRALKRKIAA